MLTGIVVSAGLLLGAALASAAQAPDPPGKVEQDQEASTERVVLVPLGEASPDLVQQAAAALRSQFHFRVEVAAAAPLPAYAWYAPRKRWRAEKLLDYLDELDVGEARHVVGLTEAPISTTKGERYDWGIAGLGRLTGKSCVLTSYLFRRYRSSDRPRYRRYMENLVLHEFGHTLGLDHCPLDRCIMADAKGNAIRAARLSINAYCPRCHRRTREWQRSAQVQGRWRADEIETLNALDGAAAGAP